MIALAAADGWWGQHGTHAVLLILPVTFMAVLAVGADVRAYLARRTQADAAHKSASWLTIKVPAALSILAALIHLGVCPEHFQEGALYGAFFAAATVAQLAWAFAVLRAPNRLVLLSGVIGNSLLVITWAITRTVGIPIGSAAGEIERVGLLDSVATLSEIVIVVLVTLGYARLQRPSAAGVSRIRGTMAAQAEKAN